MRIMSRSNVYLYSLVALLSMSTVAFAQPPEEVTFYGSEESSISSAVAVPAGRAQYWVSGTVPPEIDENAEGVAAYGDMSTQARGVFERIQTQLGEVGLGLEDVIYLRVYLVAEEGEVDYSSFFDVYDEFFNNEENSVKVGRSTVAVAGLVLPGWLIEIDALAIFPEGE